MKIIKIAILSVLLFGTSQAAETKHPSLKKVMQQLASATDELNRGIFYEDFKLIEKAALNIAIHPKPLGQLPVIVKNLGPRMKNFKGIDLKVHDSAQEIAKLAKKGDLNGIMKRHSVMMNNCVACHSQYRKEISQLFKIK